MTDQKLKRTRMGKNENNSLRFISIEKWEQAWAITFKFRLKHVILPCRVRYLEINF